jgi:hypothetical protein
MKDRKPARSFDRMRIIALCCLLALTACYRYPPPARNWAARPAPTAIRVKFAELRARLEDVTRVENFAATGPGAFTYSVQTNTVMTENDDGAAERIRRQWLAEDLQARNLCAGGYVIDSRQFVQQEQGRFANGGDIVYNGRCLTPSSPSSPPPEPPRPPKAERG